MVDLSEDLEERLPVEDLAYKHIELCGDCASGWIVHHAPLLLSSLLAEKQRRGEARITRPLPPEEARLEERRARHAARRAAASAAQTVEVRRRASYLRIHERVEAAEGDRGAAARAAPAASAATAPHADATAVAASAVRAPRAAPPIRSKEEAAYASREAEWRANYLGGLERRPYRPPASLFSSPARASFF